LAVALYQLPILQGIFRT